MNRDDVIAATDLGDLRLIEWQDDADGSGPSVGFFREFGPQYCEFRNEKGAIYLFAYHEIKAVY